MRVRIRLCCASHPASFGFSAWSAEVSFPIAVVLELRFPRVDELAGSRDFGVVALFEIFEPPGPSKRRYGHHPENRVVLGSNDALFLDVDGGPSRLGLSNDIVVGLLRAENPYRRVELLLDQPRRLLEHFVLRLRRQRVGERLALGL